jgi:hypothetical protein
MPYVVVYCHVICCYVPLSYDAVVCCHYVLFDVVMVLCAVGCWDTLLYVVVCCCMLLYVVVCCSMLLRCYYAVVCCCTLLRDLPMVECCFTFDGVMRCSMLLYTVIPLLYVFVCCASLIIEQELGFLEGKSHSRRLVASTTQWLLLCIVICTDSDVGSQIRLGHRVERLRQQRTGPPLPWWHHAHPVAPRRPSTHKATTRLP